MSLNICNRKCRKTTNVEVVYEKKKLTSIIVATIISTQFLFYQVSAVTIETNTTMETSSATIKEAEIKNTVSIKGKANLKNRIVT